MSDKINNAEADENVEMLDLVESEGEAPTNTSEKKSPLSETEHLKAELEKSQKDYLYLRAEFDNFRKQSIKERSDLLRFGGEKIARDLLNVLDVFEKALEMEVTPNNFKSFLDGVQLTKNELSGVFKKHGILEMDCKNKAFNPEQAEALGQVPSSDVKEGFVYDVMRKGYLYHDKVLRHAQVVIATKPPTTKKTEES